MKAARGDRPALIVLGGFAGTGKTTLARRLSAEWGIPTLGSDTIGRTISASEGIKDGAVNAYWIAYDVLFHLSEEFLRSGISVILDLNLGWAFQWQRLDAIRERHPQMLFVPIILRCPRELCLERIRRRHAGDPTSGPPELYTTEQMHLGIWDFLERLDRPDVHVVDAAGPQEEVYEEIERHLALRCNVTT